MLRADLKKNKKKEPSQRENLGPINKCKMSEGNFGAFNYLKKRMKFFKKFCPIL
jgi:hypothetical protein